MLSKAFVKSAMEKMARAEHPANVKVGRSGKSIRNGWKNDKQGVNTRVKARSDKRPEFVYERAADPWKWTHSVATTIGPLGSAYGLSATPRE